MIISSLRTRLLTQERFSKYKNLANSNVIAGELMPNRWDFVAFLVMLWIIVTIAIGFQQTFSSISILFIKPVSLSWKMLPQYALRTTLRMLVAMVISLFFTLFYATLAAKNRKAENILVPILDILQSVPVLGYTSITVTFFLSLFPGKAIGAECAAIFAIFTSQAWNMTFSFYQSLRTVPADLIEVSKSFQLTSWQRFWKLEVPFAIPGLVWNMMMSMSGGWFFVVASEVISIGSYKVMLPGIGSYLAAAMNCRNFSAVLTVIFTMVVVIALYDQLLFRPLIAWSNKFRLDANSNYHIPTSWFLNLIQQTQLIRKLLRPLGLICSGLARMPLHIPHKRWCWDAHQTLRIWRIRSNYILLYTIFIFLACFLTWKISQLVVIEVGWNDFFEVFWLSFLTFLRVFILTIIASIIWTPVGVFIGLRPVVAEKVQAIVQFLAAFPANLLFPAFVFVIVEYNLNPDIWLSPLIILGTQWYILFNVIAGTMIYPNEFREVVANFNIKGWQWWSKAMLPGILPYYLTGAITASGGAWNASIVVEAVSWGKIDINAHGIGAYIAQSTASGQYTKILLGILVMSIFVTLMNRIFWRPLYVWAESRFRLV